MPKQKLVIKGWYKQKIKEFEQLSEHINHEHLDRIIGNFEIEFVMKSIKNKKA